MASITDFTGIGLPPARRRYPPRKLRYSKCTFCRDPKVKTKCEPETRTWPGQKCDNCIKRGFECSVIGAVDEEDQTCLTLAVTHGHADLVDLICQFCSLETLQRVWRRKVPLHCAVYGGYYKVVQCFIKHFRVLYPEALDYASTERNLPSPFWYATRSEDITMMGMLAPYADVNRECRGYTPLAMAVIENCPDIVEYLLTSNSQQVVGEKRVNVNSVTKDSGQTPLDLAIEGGNQRCIELLMGHNAQTGSISECRDDQMIDVGLGELLYANAATLSVDSGSSESEGDSHR